MSQIENNQNAMTSCHETSILIKANDNEHVSIRYSTFLTSRVFNQMEVLNSKIFFFT